MVSFQTLISVEQLNKMVSRSAGSNRFTIFDCRFSLADPDQGRKKYREGHIPGAIYVHLDDDLAGEITEDTGRHPLPDINDFIRKLGNRGVGSADQVVVYDDVGGAVAGRMWWMLRWAGHDNVALLDGGYPAWTRAMLPVSTEEVTEQVGDIATFPPGVEKNDPSGMQVRIAQLIDGLRTRGIRLFDARNASRFRGEQEPIDPVAGHVPGAENLPFEGNLDENGFFLKPEQLRRRFEKVLGINNGDRENIVHMCGSGVTACHNILAMEIAGIPNTKLYVGSWSEWIRDSDRAVARGD